MENHKALSVCRSVNLAWTMIKSAESVVYPRWAQKVLGPGSLAASTTCWKPEA
jgi:hypothetical protein